MKDFKILNNVDGYDICVVILTNESFLSYIEEIEKDISEGRTVLVVHVFPDSCSESMVMGYDVRDGEIDLRSAKVIERKSLKKKVAALLKKFFM